MQPRDIPPARGPAVGDAIPTGRVDAADGRSDPPRPGADA